MTEKTKSQPAKAPTPDASKNKTKSKPDAFVGSPQIAGVPNSAADRRRDDADPLRRRIAYFTMEIGVDERIPTYSGGLGILAGDTLKSCADLNVPVVCMTLLYRGGYFDQSLDAQGRQKESATTWDPADILAPLDARITVKIEGRDVQVAAWEFAIEGVMGSTVPVVFLDTDLPENSDWDRKLTHALYSGGERERLAQEILLGVGGVRMLEAAGYKGVQKFHMNEGHSSLLVLELLERSKAANNGRPNPDAVREQCIFTTHTPVPAGHDKFPYTLVKDSLKGYLPLAELKKIGGEEELNMTLLALNNSGYVNGVAKLHGKVSRKMFPGYPIDSITNGMHARTWSCQPMQKLFDRFIPDWWHDPYSLRHALRIPRIEIWNAHLAAKKDLFQYIKDTTGEEFEMDVFTIGFARRAATYKRANLIFRNMERLVEISKKAGRIQLVFSGKAHPKDEYGKQLIHDVVQASHELKGKVKVVYLPNYSMKFSKLLVSGVDVWLNNPTVPHEASGTSGMKAALNGVPHFSTLDGWWVEGHVEGVTGWVIGSGANGSAEAVERQEIESLYHKLEKVILPLYGQRWEKWVDVMRNSIAINGSYFNTHRMVNEYVINSYIC